MANKVVTVTGTAQVDTAVKKFGTGSLLLDGNSDNLQLPASAAWVPAADYTMEGWVYIKDHTNDAQCILGQETDTTRFIVQYRWRDPGGGVESQMELYDNVNNEFVTLSGGTISDNTWYHWALVDDGGTVTFYWDGVGTGITFGTPTNATKVLMIGRTGDGGANYFDGQMDEIRIVIGTAVYTSNFTPPTEELEGIANCELLLHMNGADASTTFYDYSDGNYYPDPNVEATTVDGWTRRFDQAADNTWDEIHDQGGTQADDSAATSQTVIQEYTANNLYINIARSIYLFDTSSIPDGDAVSAATMSVYGTGIDDSSWTNTDIAFNVYSSDPDSNTALSATDYDLATYGATAYCDTSIDIDTWATAGYNDFAFNATGIAAISLTGITKLSGRDATYDASDTDPTTDGSTHRQGLSAYFSEVSGTSTDPKLVVTHSEAAAGPATLKTLDTAAAATIKTINGAAIATVKTWNTAA